MGGTNLYVNSIFLSYDNKNTKLHKYPQSIHNEAR